MIKGLLKTTLKIAVIGGLIYLVSPTLLHSFSSTIGEAFGTVWLGIKEEVDEYAKERIVEWAKTLPTQFWKDMTTYYTLGGE